MRKRLRYFSVGIILCLFLCLCSGCQLIYGKFFVDTEDTNGAEDTSLAVFTEEDICSPKMENYCVAYGMERSGETSFEDEDFYHDYDMITSSASTPASGILIQQITYGKTDTIRFTVEPELQQGNLRIVLLDENYKILYDFSTRQTSSVEITDAAGKEFQVRAIGEAALFELKTTREFL